MNTVEMRWCRVEKDEYEKDVLEVSDIKKILGCGINQAYALVKSKAFHTVKVGRKIKIPKESFYRWYHGEREQA